MGDPSRYRVQGLLKDLVVLDMLELTGSTAAAARLLHLSQPTVSRRARWVMAQLDLLPPSDDQPGRKFKTTAWLQLLRQGVNSHRLSWGVLRIGGAEASAMGLQGQAGVEWVTLGRRQMLHWQPWLELELLDAVLLQVPPPVSVAGARPYRLLPCANGWLACRIEPQVLQLAASLKDQGW